MHRRALAIRLKALGEGHPDTATSYNNLAVTLRDQGKHAEAEAMHRRALAIRLKALGEGHPHTATSYNNLAVTLGDQGKYAEAEAMHRRALAIRPQGPGRGPPRHRHQLRQPGLVSRPSRQARRRPADLDRGRGQLRTGPVAGRQRARCGADGRQVSAPAFALALARAGQPRDAWARWEQGLARGLADEVTGRAARPLTAAEHDREALLLGQAQALDERIGKLLALKALSQEQDKLLEDLNRQASELRRQVLELEQAVREQVSRPRRPARHARSRPEGPPRGDGPDRLDRSGSLPLGLPAAALRRPRSGSGSPAPARTAPGPRRSKGGRNASAPSSTRRPPKATPARWPRRWRGSGSNR